MIHAFFGLSARADAAHAALIVADALTVIGKAVTLLRVTLPNEAALPPRSVASDSLAILEREVPDVGSVGPTLDALLPAEVCADRDVILDLPSASLVDAGVSARIGLAVATVGPSNLCEHAAAALVAALPVDLTGPGAIKPPWLLACGRGDAAAVAALGRSVSIQAAALAARHPCRVLPAALPALGRRDAERVANGDRTARTLRVGLALVAAMRAAADTPAAAQADAEAFARNLMETARNSRPPDEREAGERLHDLADEISGIAEGTKPTDDDLADVPRLEGWRIDTRSVQVLTGIVYGHPAIPDGRRITSSDLYASDGETWARTLSRYYLLGRRAEGSGGRPRH